MNLLLSKKKKKQAQDNNLFKERLVAKKPKKEARAERFGKVDDNDKKHFRKNKFQKTLGKRGRDDRSRSKGHKRFKGNRN